MNTCCFLRNFLSLRQSQRYHSVNSTNQTAKHHDWTKASVICCLRHGSSTTHRDWELRRSTETSSERGAFIGSFCVFFCLFSVVTLKQRIERFGAWWFEILRCGSSKREVFFPNDPSYSVLGEATWRSQMDSCDVDSIYCFFSSSLLRREMYCITLSYFD